MNLSIIHNTILMEFLKVRMSENIVSITDMQFYRGEREIYKDISLSVKRGAITAIMGPSGIGKTTLLKI
ncbi:MAG: phospholipid/cholesterol/gamma-HCH transport system ATP-binding protein, partial [Kangiellaceae bacterium]